MKSKYLCLLILVNSVVYGAAKTGLQLAIEKQSQKATADVLAITLPAKIQNKPLLVRLKVAQRLYKHKVYGRTGYNLTGALSPLVVGTGLYLGRGKIGEALDSETVNKVLGSMVDWSRSNLFYRSQRDRETLMLNVRGAVAAYAALFGGIYTLVRGVGSWYQATENTFKDVFKSGGRSYEAIEHTKILYIAMKHLLPKGIDTEVRRHFMLAAIEPQKVASSILFIQQAVNLPFSYQDVTCNLEYAKNLFKAYPKEIQEQLENQCFGIAESKKARVPVYYYHGVPGSGKSYAGNLLARALNLPYTSMSLGSSSKKAIIGSKYESSDSDPGIMIKAMMKPAAEGMPIAKNMVLVIDEFDRLVNDDSREAKETTSWMLSLLDPDNDGKFHSPYFDATLELPTIIILTGNSKIKDIALRRRFKNLHFTGFDREVKVKVMLTNYVPKIMKMRNIPEGLLSKNPELKKIITQLVLGDKDPGFRTINLLVDDLLLDAVRLIKMNRISKLAALSATYQKRLVELNKELKEMNY